MFKKKSMAGLLSLSLLATGLVSGPAQAATGVDWNRTPADGDRYVRVTIRGASSSDFYRIYTSKERDRNAENIGSGRVDVSGNSRTVSLDLDSGKRLQKDQWVYVEVDGKETTRVRVGTESTYWNNDYYDRNRDWDRGGRFNNDGDIYTDSDGYSRRVYRDGRDYYFYNSRDRKIYIDMDAARNVPSSYNYNYARYPRNNGNTSRTPWPPKEMTVSVTSLPRSGGPVVVHFDRNYGIGGEDHVVIEGLDSAGAVVSTEKVRIADKGLPVAKTLTPMASVAKYRVTYQGGPGNEAQLVKEITVSGAPAEPGFGEARGLSLDYGITQLSAGAKVAAPKVQMVDANGKKAPYIGTVSFSISGDALANAATSGLGDFQVRADAKPGAKVVVRATAGQLRAEQTFSIPSLEQMALTSTISRVTAGQSVSVPVQITANGKATNIPWAVKDAKLTVTGSSDFAAAIQSETLATDGKMNLTVQGKTPGTQQINLEIRDPEGKVLSIRPLTLQVDAAVAKHNVTMNINANTMIVDGKVVQLDTQPIILQNRTYIPYRALAQAFGAKVDFNNANRAVTVTLGEQKIVMFVGQKNYTVNGQAKTMDVAPFINKNNRTMVPVRFAANGLGFSVTPLYRGNGTVQGVSFSN